VKMMVKCGDDNCRYEFSADTDSPEWVCPRCERVIKNPHFPFLTARIMHSRYKPEEVDWEYLFEKLLEDVHKYFGQKRAFLSEGAEGAWAKKNLSDDELGLFRASVDEDPGFVDELRQRFDGDLQKMHDALLEEAQGLAAKLMGREGKD